MTPDPAEVYEIEDVETFEMLADPTRMEILERLFEPASVGEVADDMGVPRTRLYHHVNLLEDAGMIRVVDTRRRGAMEEKIYRVTALSFRPSRAFLAGAQPRAAAAAVVDSLFAVTRADVVRSFDRGVASFDQTGERRSLMMTRSLQRLTDERRDALVRELEEVLARYDDDDPDGRPVGVVALVYPSSRRLP
ncbi:MAG: helix-turn-helix domain-containing protein [Acidimicrobiia bacterium]|jgi:DNA-binding transcriptional ArsR family regulator